MAKESNANSLISIFLLFAKIGLFTFGGGLAMLPIMQKAVIHQKGWMNDQEFVDMLAITNATPGAFAINASIFIGYRQRGIMGAIAGALGTSLPSFIVILIVAYIIVWGGNILWLEKFFIGVRPAVVALILDAGIKLGQKTIKDAFDVILLIIGILLITLTSIHPALVILAGGVVGIIYGRIKPPKKQSTSETAGGK